MKTTQSCLSCQEKFEADTKDTKRGRAKYCSLSCAQKENNKLRKKKICTCIHCGTEFEGIYKAKFCSYQCKQRNYRKRQNTNSINIKAIYKQIQHLPCCICGWQEATRDIHHIVPVSKGGTNDLTNLVVLCPNHHRMAHSNLISEDVLRDANNRTISSSSNEELDAVGSP